MKTLFSVRYDATKVAGKAQYSEQEIKRNNWFMSQPWFDPSAVYCIPAQIVHNDLDSNNELSPHLFMIKIKDEEVSVFSVRESTFEIRYIQEGGDAPQVEALRKVTTSGVEYYTPNNGPESKSIWTNLNKFPLWGENNEKHLNEPIWFALERNAMVWKYTSVPTRDPNVFSKKIITKNKKIFMDLSQKKVSIFKPVKAMDLPIEEAIPLMYRINL